MLSNLLTEKYNVPVPRYTSYPPATFFHEGFTETHLLQAIRNSNKQRPSQLSFYFHIPFCRHRCTYCGCNAYPMPDKAGIAAYMNALANELHTVLPLLDPHRPISQVHFGGGSPTSVPAYHLKTLMDTLFSAFPLSDKPEIAIECHPGYLSMNDWKTLVEIGFNRCSIGVQDFNPSVLKAVHRKPSLEPIEKIVAFLQSKEVSVNLDFIYGLPLQTVESLADTMQQATKIRPNRIVTFSYAHIPWVHPAQKALEKHGLPNSSLKSALYETTRTILTQKGYERIGMDHFVLPGDELDAARRQDTLHRNFQGYCTWKTTGQVYAFGVTGISQLATVYAQNTKSIPEYIQQAHEKRLPVAKGYQLSDKEQWTREIITSLLCNGKLQWASLAARLGFATAESLKKALSYNDDKLREMAEDGLIELTTECIRITEAGSRFVRNVAAVFDPLYQAGTPGYSLPV